MKLMKKIIEWLYLRQSDNLAYYDRLTRLYNRNWWELHAKAKMNNRNLYLTIIDLDDLKKVNDSRGHLSGDELLQTFSLWLKKFFPKADLCRLGGDEFLIVSKDEPIDKLFELSKKRSFHFSFGCCHKSNIMSMSDALRKADENMYRMKSWHKENN